MSNLINVIVPEQGFEIVRNRIGEILADEFENQALNYNPEISANIFVERTQHFDHTELSAVNVCLATGSYNNKHQGSVVGTYQYNIDVYVKSKTNPDEKGDVLAAKKLQRLLGFCRYVLEDPYYKTLGYMPGFIGRVFAGGIAIAQPEDKDAANVMMGRLILNVQLTETNSLSTPKLIAGYETTVKIDVSTQGYYYEGNT